MSEEKTNEESEDTTPTEDAGNKPTTTPLIDIANAAAERMEKANEKREELLQREEEIAARRMFSGRADAGKEVVQKTQEEVDQEAADGMINQLT